jgi:TM2 domain-containing membrane protein YozV
MFCSNCGGKIEDGAKFCPGCGKAASNEQVAPTVQQGVNVIQQQPAVSHSQTPTADEKFCFSCGAVIKKAAEICPKCGVNQSMRNSTTAIDVYCSSCGKSIKKEAAICPFCGVAQGGGASSGQKNKTTAIICWLFGVHRFYVGKIGTGILYWLTLGGMGIWTIIDIVTICTDKFTDAQGNLLKKN